MVYELVIENEFLFTILSIILSWLLIDIVDYFKNKWL